jgi:hypothetical protein
VQRVSVWPHSFPPPLDDEPAVLEPVPGVGPTTHVALTSHVPEQQSKLFAQ